MKLLKPILLVLLTIMSTQQINAQFECSFYTPEMISVTPLGNNNYEVVWEMAPDWSCDITRWVLFVDMTGCPSICGGSAFREINVLNYPPTNSIILHDPFASTPGTSCTSNCPIESMEVFIRGKCCSSIGGSTPLSNSIFLDDLCQDDNCTDTYVLEAFDWTNDGSPNMLCIREELDDGSLSDAPNITSVSWSSSGGPIDGPNNGLCLTDDNNMLQNHYGEVITAVFTYNNGECMGCTNIEMPICEVGCSDTYVIEPIDWTGDGCPNMLCVREELDNGGLSDALNINEVEWTSTGGPIAGNPEGPCLTDDNNNLFDHEGEIITVTFTYNNGACDASASFDMSVCGMDFNGSGHAKSSELTPQANEIGIYPNPANEVVHLSNLNEAALTLRIYNINGSLIHEYNFDKQSTAKINTSLLPTGTYLFSINGNHLIKSQKVIINH